MNIITKNEAIQKMFEYGKIIHCEEYEVIYKDQIYKEQFTTYESNGCVIVKNEYIYEDKRCLCRNIHQVSKEANIDAAYNDVLREETGGDINIFIYGELPENLNEYGCSKKFHRYGELYDENNIRILSSNDKEAILTFCSSFDEDTNVAKREANIFKEFALHFDDDNWIIPILLGAFVDGKIIGIVSVCKYDHTCLAQVLDLVVRKDFRQQGWGKRLVKKALSIYPEMEYFYSASKRNIESITLAKSIGFKFVGAELFVAYEE